MQTSAVNCYGTLEYRYSVIGSSIQSTSETSAIFYLDGNQSYEFSILALNEEGLQSAFRTKTGSPPLGK